MEKFPVQSLLAALLLLALAFSVHDHSPAQAQAQAQAHDTTRISLEMACKTNSDQGLGRFEDAGAGCRTQIAKNLR